MIKYKHTQIGYLMIVITLIVLALFVWMNITARAEPPSVDSGTNFLFTSVMVLIVVILSSFTTLTISIDETYLRLKFGFGIFKKKFALHDIASAKVVKNHWYYGWGIKIWFWPKMRIYSVSGLDAVEIVLHDGHIFRLGTDEPQNLESAIKQVIN